MARVEMITDDLDGSPGAVEVRFSLEDRRYTIDLSEANRAKLEAALAPFIDKARSDSVGRSIRARPAGASSSEETPEQREAIRRWAKANGFQVGDRGRISDTVRSAYRAANK